MIDTRVVLVVLFTLMLAGCQLESVVTTPADVSISMSLDTDVVRPLDDLTITIHNDSAEPISFDRNYSMQRLIMGNWVEVRLEYEYEPSTLNLNPGNSWSQTVLTPVHAGTYRLIKQYITQDSTHNHHNLSQQFSLRSDTTLNDAVRGGRVRMTIGFDLLEQSAYVITRNYRSETVYLQYPYFLERNVFGLWIPVQHNIAWANTVYRTPPQGSISQTLHAPFHTGLYRMTKYYTLSTDADAPLYYVTQRFEIIKTYTITQ